MKYLHTMVRVSNLEKSLEFYCKCLGLVETKRVENKQGRFTLVFLVASQDQDSNDKSPLLELTYNWDKQVYSGGRNFGHLAYLVDNIYATCEQLQKSGIVIHRPPRDGHMAFIKSPDDISIELLQKGPALPPQEPWQSMNNSGESW